MNRSVFGLFTAIVLALLFACSSPVKNISFIDVHTHFSPMGEGFSKSPTTIRKGWKGLSVKHLILEMDRTGIEKMVIMLPPTAIRLGVPESDFGIPEMAEQYPDRFIVMYGGVALTRLNKAALKGKFTRKQEKKFLKELTQALGSGKYDGIGEIGLHHFSSMEKGLGNREMGQIPANHPWMLILSDIAAEYDIPIDIHMAATNQTLRALEQLLAHNRRTKIIWAHAGWSESGQGTAKVWNRMLKRNSNLYGSIKNRRPKGISANTSVRVQDIRGKPDPQWFQVFEKYPSRFMIGSDIKPGVFFNRDQFSIVKYSQELLQALPSNLRDAFARENARKIFNLSK